MYVCMYEYTDTNPYPTHQIRIANVQIDNPTDIGHAVVLQRDGGRDTDVPCAHICIVRKFSGDDKTMFWYKYVAGSLQGMRLSLHEGHVLVVMAWVQAVVNASGGLVDASGLTGSAIISWLQVLFFVILFSCGCFFL